jgi:hypothetical protein
MKENQKHVYRRWLNRTHRIAVIFGAIMLITAVACIYPLPPTQLFPPDGTVFDRDPHWTTLEWKPLIGAVMYRVEVDCLGCCGDSQWCTDLGEEWYVADETDSTHNFDFGDTHIGRWRVSGINSQGQEGQRSGWWEFTYPVAE